MNTQRIVHETEEEDRFLGLGSQDRRGAPHTAIKSILKKASKILKSDIAAARYEGEQPKKTDKLLPSFSLQTSLSECPPPFSSLPQSNSSSPQSAPKRFSPIPHPHPPPRVPRSHSVSSSPSSSQVSFAVPSLLQQLTITAKQIQRSRQELAAQLTQTHQKCMSEALELITKKQEMAGGPGAEEGGSETERGECASNRLAMKLAVRQFVTDSMQREELLRLIEMSGTPRLSILMKKHRIEGLYKQCPMGFVKVYGGIGAPETVQPSQVRKCFEFKSETFSPVPQKQLWKADAFAL